MQHAAVMTNHWLLGKEELDLPISIHQGTSVWTRPFYQAPMPIEQGIRSLDGETWVSMIMKQTHWTFKYVWLCSCSNELCKSLIIYPKLTYLSKAEELSTHTHVTSVIYVVGG